MDRRRAAGALLALAACIACSAAAPTASNHTALDLYEASPEGCFYNFQHYGEGDRIMTNEPCLNCTCHNRMLMCYLRVCPFTKPIGQDCTVEKRADQCCPIVTCPDVPVDLLTSTSTSSPAEYGATGIGKLDRYGCSINGKYFSEGSKVPSTPNKPCEHCYCIRNMTTCVMQECTLHVDGCTPIYHKDVCCPVRYSCDHPEDEIPLLDDMTTTVRPTPGFLLTTTTMAAVTQMTQDCVHDDKVFADGALIKTEKACEHCYCMKGDIVCVVQECGTPMENEGKNCTSLPPREGQCCPDTYICEGDDITTELPEELTTEAAIEKITTLSPPRRVGVEGSGYRNEPDDVSYTHIPFTEPEIEGSGDEFIKEEKPEDINETQAPVLPGENLSTIDAIPQSISTKAPTTDNYEKESTEENISEQSHHYIPTSTDIPQLDEKITSEISHFETTTSSEFESSKLDKIAPSTTDNIKSEGEESKTTKSEGYDTVTDSLIQEESAMPHKDIVTTTAASNIEEMERLTTIMDNQVFITEGISEDIYGPHKYATSTINAFEEDSVTTDSYKESDLVPTEKSEQESSIPSKYVPSATSTPFLEEVEKGSTETLDEQSVVTNEVIEESSQPHVVITTSVPTLDEKITEPSKDKDIDTNIDSNKDSVEPLEHKTSATIEDFAKTTTESYEKESANTETSETKGDQPHEHVESTITDSALGETERATTTRIDTDNIITYATTALPDSENEIIKTTSSVPVIEEILTETAKPDQYITNESTEKESNKPEEYITTLKTPISDVTDTDSFDINKNVNEIAGETTEQIISEPDVSITTNIPTVESYKTTTEINEQNVVTHDISEKVDTVSHEHIPITTSITSIEESEKTTIVPAKVTDEITTENNYELNKSETTNAPIAEDNEMVTTDTYREEDHISSETTSQEDSKPSEYGSSTSSTPFLEEVEKATMESQGGHVSDQVTEHESYEPHKHETSTFITEEVPSEPEKGVGTTTPSKISEKDSLESSVTEKTQILEETTDTELIQPTKVIDDKETHEIDALTTSGPSYVTSPSDSFVTKEDLYTVTTEPTLRKEDDHTFKAEPQNNIGISTTVMDNTEGVTSTFSHAVSTEATIVYEKESKPTVSLESVYTHEIEKSTPDATTEVLEPSKHSETGKPEMETTSGIVAGDMYTTPIIEKVDMPETTTLNLGENEIHEDSLLSHGRIPGEGDCLLNGITYTNESTVPSTNKCTSGCRCVSSIIKCDPIICSPPPEYMDNCQPVYDSPESCCPTYICDQLRETLPPLPHIKVTTPETPEQPSAIECHGNQCKSSEDKIQPNIPFEEKGESTQCESQDCIKDIEGSGHAVSSSEHPEPCSDDKCTPIKESCSNGECQETPIHPLPVIPCVGDSCISAPETQPCVNDETCKEVKIPEISTTPCEGDSCTHIKENCISGDCSTTIDSPPEDSQQKVTCDDNDGCKEIQDNRKECLGDSCRRNEPSDSDGTPSLCSGLNCEEPAIDSTSQQSIDTSEHDQTTESPVIDVSQQIITESSDSESTERYTEVKLPELSTVSVIDKKDETVVPESEESFTKMPEKEPDQELPSRENEVTKESELSSTEPDTKLPETATSAYTSSEDVVEEITETPALDIQKDMLTTKEPKIFVTDSDVNMEVSNTAETVSPHDESYTKVQTSVPDTQESVTKAANEEEIQTKKPIDFEVEEKESSLVTEEPSVSTVPGEEIISDHQEFITKAPEPSDGELPESYVTQPQEETLMTDHEVTASPDAILEKETITPEDSVAKQESTTKKPQDIITDPVNTEYDVTTIKSPETLITTTEPAEKVTELEESIHSETSVQPQLEEHTETKTSNEQELTTQASVPEITIPQKENTVTQIEESEDKTELPFYPITESQEPVTNAEEDVITEEKTLAPMTSLTEEVLELTTPKLAIGSEQDKIIPELPESHETDTVTLVTESVTTEKDIIDEYEPQFTKPQEIGESKPQEEIISASTTLPTVNIEEYSSTEPGISVHEKIEHESTVSVQTETETETETFKESDDESRTALPELFTTRLPDRTTESLYSSEEEHIHADTTPSSQTMISEHEINTESPDLLSPEKEKLSTEKTSTASETEKIFTEGDDIHTPKQELPSIEKITPSITEEEPTTEISEKVTENVEPTIADAQEVDMETPVESSDKPTETSTAPSIVISTESQVDVTEKIMIPEVTQIEESTEPELPVKVTEGEEHEIITDLPNLEITTSADIPEYISTQSQQIGDKTPEDTIPHSTQTETPMISTKAPEFITTQVIDRDTEISELVTHETITEKATVIDEDIHTESNIMTEPQEISTDLSGEVTDSDSATEHILSTRGPEEQEATTHISEVQSMAPEEEQSPDVLVPLVTEPQETSTNPTDIRITEPQKSVTEFSETSTEKQIETDDSEITPTTEAILQADKASVTDIHKHTTDQPTTLSVDTEMTDLHLTTVESQDTIRDHEDTVTELVIPVIVSSDRTDTTHGITQMPESMITGLEEIDTSSSLTSDHIPHHKETQTTPNQSAETVETSTKILEPEVPEPEEKVTKAPEISTPEKEVTDAISHEAHTLPQETITETHSFTETSTELIMNPISEAEEEMTQSPAQSAQTSSPKYEHAETTPYLVELEEHTHKILDETTISPADDEKIPAHPEPDQTKDDNLRPEISTETPTVDQSEIKKESTQVQEQTTEQQTALSAAEPEKSTQLTTIAQEEELERTTQLMIAETEEEPEKISNLPTAASEEPEKSTNLPTTLSELVVEKSTHLPTTVSEEVLDKSTGLPITVHEEVPEKSTHSLIEDNYSITTEPQENIDHTSTDLNKEITTSVPIKHTDIEKVTSPDSDITGQTEKDTSLPETPLQPSIPIEITTVVDEELSRATTKVSTESPEEVATQSSVPVDKPTQPEEKPSEPPTTAPELPKPVVSEPQPTGEIPLPEEDTHFPPSGSSGYGGEDYGEEDQAFGPGTCRYGGKVYVSAQQIPRDDPCDFCFCFRSDIICLQQSCPPPIHGCHEEPIQGFCCPRYECPVSMATTLNVTTTTTTTTTTLPPHFPTHPYKGAAQRRGCQIKGHTYKVGEFVRASSGPCLHCTCGGDGQMKCDPKACTPEPMLRQMIAAAVSAKRRR